MRGMDVAATDTLNWGMWGREWRMFFSPAAKLTIIHSAVMRDRKWDETNITLFLCASSPGLVNVVCDCAMTGGSELWKRSDSPYTVALAWVFVWGASCEDSSHLSCVVSHYPSSFERYTTHHQLCFTSIRGTSHFLIHRGWSFNSHM